MNNEVSYLASLLMDAPTHETKTPVNDQPVIVTDRDPANAPRVRRSLRRTTPKSKSASFPLPHLPVEEFQNPLNEVPLAVQIGGLDCAAFNIIKKVMGAPTATGANTATWGERQRLAVRSDADGRGRWRDSLGGVTGDHFHELLMYVLRVDRERAIVIGRDLTDGVDVDKARQVFERKFGKPVDTSFLALWNAAQPIRGSWSVKPLRQLHEVDIRFHSSDLENIRGDRECRLYALHRDPLTDAPVGLTIFNKNAQRVEAHGETTAPVPMSENWRDKDRIILADSLLRALYVSGFTQPVLLLPGLHHRTQLPALPKPESLLVALNPSETKKCAALNARFPDYKFRPLPPDIAQEFPS